LVNERSYVGRLSSKPLGGFHLSNSIDEGSSMITIYKSGERGVEEIEKVSRGSWVNVVNPDAREIAYLSEELGIPVDFVIASLDVDERSRTDKEGESTLVLLRIPFFNGESADIPYSTLPLGIIFTDALFITVCKEDNDILSEFVAGQVSDFSTSMRNRFILHILLRTATRYLSCVI